MASDDVDAGYASYPTSGDLIGKAYEHQNRDRAAMLKVQQKEHYLIPGTNLAEHGRHLMGSAISYVGTSAPTLRPNDGSHTPAALSADDNGRLWVDTTNATYPVLKEYVHGTGWVELFKLNVDTAPQGTESLAIKTLAQILDQVLLRGSDVRFNSVKATVDFIGKLTGTADKIRTSTVSSPAAGDIWVE